MLLSIVLALVGIGVLHLPRRATLNVLAGVLFICALLTSLVNQAGV